MSDAEKASYAAMIDARTELARIISEIAQFSGSAYEPDIAARRRLAAITNDALTMAGLLGAADIALAMRTLHALVDDLNDMAVWSVEAVALNCQAIVILAHKRGMSQHERTTLIEGVAKVAEKARRCAETQR
ncbi:MAG: hypothetical protein HXY28_07385 [Hydrogenophilaceae bacterium]|nr:hypothetical protein [Hydrogenophilaceae bacterium]